MFLALLHAPNTSDEFDKQEGPPRIWRPPVKNCLIGGPTATSHASPVTTAPDRHQTRQSARSFSRSVEIIL